MNASSTVAVSKGTCFAHSVNFCGSLFCLREGEIKSTLAQCGLSSDALEQNACSLERLMRKANDFLSNMLTRYMRSVKALYKSQFNYIGIGAQAFPNAPYVILHKSNLHEYIWLPLIASSRERKTKYVF